MLLEQAKQLLHSAESSSDRENAVRESLSLGMPLQEIEEYLDLLDAAAVEISKELRNETD